MSCLRLARIWSISSSVSLPASWKRGSRDASSAVLSCSGVIAFEALTIESISQNWRMFMKIGKRPITLGKSSELNLGQYQIVTHKIT